MGKISKNVSWEIVKKIFFPLLILGMFIYAYILYKINIEHFLSSQFHQEFKKYVWTLLGVTIAVTAQRVLTAVIGWYKENVVSKTITDLDDKMLPLISRTFKIIIWIIAFLVILPFYGVNISALVATLGISSLAIALAAQDTISNIISGFMIMIDSPFRVGDQIKLPTGEIVAVLDIGIRRSKFLAQDQAIIIMPNLELSKSKIINYTYGEERRAKKQNSII